MKLAIFLGTRPEIIKLAPLIELLYQKKTEFILIHSGQHYDLNMSEIFFDELSLPSPHYNIDVGSESHGEQIGRMLIEFERVLNQEAVDAVIAEGDTNTVLAAGITCAKQGIPFIHIEAGIRSFDETMQEELNRRLVAICTNIHFAPTNQAALNLLFEGINSASIHVVGNTIVDAVYRHRELANQKGFNFQRYGLTPQESFILMTLHRAENVDNVKRLKNIFSCIKSINCKILFLAHPRTRKRINEFSLIENMKNLDNLIFLESVGYLEFLFLLQKAKIVLTDSGGIQEEAFTLRIPCATLRTTTERPETLKYGANRLIDPQSPTIASEVNKILENRNEISLQLATSSNPYGDGNASERILTILEKLWSEGRFQREAPEFHGQLHPTRILTSPSKTINQQTDLIVSFDKEGHPFYPPQMDKCWMQLIMAMQEPKIDLERKKDLQAQENEPSLQK